MYWVANNLYELEILKNCLQKTLNGKKTHQSRKIVINDISLKLMLNTLNN